MTKMAVSSAISKWISNFVLEMISFFLILIYRMFGAAENRRLLSRRIVHQIQRYYRLICFKVFGKIPWVKTMSLNDDMVLGDLLQDVVMETENWWFSRCKYMEPYAEFEEWMVAAIFSRNIVDVRYVGSTRETTGSLHYSETVTDIDMMYIYRDFKISESGSTLPPCSSHLLMVNSQTPGYVVLQLNCTKDEMVSVYRDIAKQGQFDSHLQVFNLMDEFEQRVIVKINDGISSELGLSSVHKHFVLRSDYFRLIHERFNRARFTGWMHFKQQGPASKIVWNVAALPHRLMLGNMDIVFAVHCSEWPSQAKEWLNRPRRYDYPSRKIMDDIVTYGADIVPKSSYTKREPSTSLFSWFDIKEFEVEEDQFQIEWRLSFSIAELILVKSWSSSQKCAYRLFKTLRSDYLSQYGITSYALKNIMLYLVEEVDKEFWKANLIVIMNELLDWLIKRCLSRNCPHYFIKNNNLFTYLDPVKLTMAAVRCKSIQKNWYLSMLLSDGLWFEIKIRGYSPRFYNLPSRQQLQLESQKCAEVEMQRKIIDSTFKIYYCFKIHKEVQKFTVNSFISPNYNTRVVVTAVERYLQSKMKSGTVKTTQENILLAHVAWSMIKSLRYQMNREDKTSRDGSIFLPDEASILQKIEDVLERYLLPNKTSGYVTFAEYLIQNNIQKSSQLAQSLPIVDGLDDLLNPKHAPIMLSSFDSHLLHVTKGFQFKSSCFFYPSSLLRVVLAQMQGKCDHDSIVSLLDKTATLWENFPSVKNVQRYQPIIIPLAKHVTKSVNGGIKT